MSTIAIERYRWFTASFMLTISLLGTVGCQSPLNPRVRMQDCQGGSCGAPVASDTQPKQSPAQLFAEMNYQAIADVQLDQAERDVKLAKIPSGPDSLFAAYR